MATELTIFSADYLVDDKPYCRYDMFAELSNEAVEFIERSISLAERKKAVVQIVLKENELRTEMYVPHGIFLKNMSEMLAKLILMSSACLFISGPAESPFQIKIHLNYELKSTE